jgi:hypothetical protein
MTTTDADRDAYLNGFRIAGQHCGGCGRPDGTQDGWSHGMRVLNTTPCCGRLACNGLVTTTPWVGNETGREVWACCIGEARRRLGEQVKLCLDPERSAVR